MLDSFFKLLPSDVPPIQTIYKGAHLIGSSASLYSSSKTVFGTQLLFTLGTIAALTLRSHFWQLLIVIINNERLN